MADADAAAAEVDQAFVAFFPRVHAVARYARLSPIEAPIVGYAVTSPDVARTDLPAAVAPGARLVQVPLRFPNILDQFSFQAIATIPVTDYVFRLAQNYNAASARLETGGFEVAAARARARTDGQLLFYAWARAKLTVTVAGEAVLQAKAHLSDLQRALENQSANRADMVTMRSRLASAEELEGRARNLDAVLEERLRVVLDARADEALSLGEDLASPLSLPALPPSRELLAEAVSRRPELRSLGATSDALVSQAGAARASGWPRVDLQGELTSASPNARYIPQTDSVRTTWSVGVQISLSPNDALSAACVARAIEAKQTGLLHQRRALQEGLRVEIALALEARGNAALAQVSTLRGLEAAEEAYRIRKLSFGLGRTTRAHPTT